MWHQAYDSTSWSAMLAMMTLMSVLTAAVIVAIVRSTRSRTERTAVRVLEERYARGEVDDDEYDERRRRLMQR